MSEMTKHLKKRALVMSPSERSVGFTMLELLITMAVLAIISALAIPSVSTFLQRQRISTSSQAISSAFSLARSEALNRVANIDVCWVRSTPDTRGRMSVLTTVAPIIELSSVEFGAGGLNISDNEGATPCVRFTAQGRIDLATQEEDQLIFGVCVEGDSEDFSEVVTIQLAGRPVVNDNDGSAAGFDCV